MLNRYLSRKFLLSVFVLLVGTTGLFTEYIDAPNFTALAALVIGLYGGSNVAGKIRSGKTKTNVELED